MEKSIKGSDLIDILKGEYKGKTSHDYSRFYKGDDVYISSIRVVDSVDFYLNISYDYRIYLEYITFDRDVQFVEGNWDLLSFSRVTFKGSLSFVKGTFQKLFLNELVLESNLIFENGDYGLISLCHINCNKAKEINGHKHKSINKADVGFNGGVYDSITVDCSDFSLFSVSGSDILINNFSISKAHSGSFNIDKSVVNNLSLKGNNSFCSFSINDARIHKLTLDEFSSDSITLSNVKILKRRLKLSEMSIDKFYKVDNISDGDIEILKQSSLPNDIFTNEDPIYKLPIPPNRNDLFERKVKYMYEIDEDSIVSTLFIKKSKLHNMEMKSVDFSDLEEVKIISTDISEMKLFDTLFPTENIKGTHKANYETFNNLFSIAKRKNNKRDQIEYYKASKEALRKYNYERFKNEKKVKYLPISLTLSKLYSNHGVNWGRAVLFTILFGLVFFILMMLSTKYYFDFKFRKESLDNFVNLIKYFIQFLNPVHKLTFMDKLYPFSDYNWFVVLDFLGRIFVGMGIYEVVNSFRKFTRK